MHLRVLPGGSRDRQPVRATLRTVLAAFWYLLMRAWSVPLLVVGWVLGVAWSMLAVGFMRGVLGGPKLDRLVAEMKAENDALSVERQRMASRPEPPSPA